MSTQNSTKPSKLTTEKLIFRHADDLHHQEFRVLAVVLTYTDEHCRNAFPGRARIMQAIGCKDKKRVSEILRSLTDKGYLVKTGEPHYGPDGNLSTRYDVKVPTRILKRVLEAEDSPLVDNHEVADAQSTRGEGVLSTPPGGVVSTPPQGVVSTPLSDPVSGPASGPENPCTVTADASTAPKESKDGKGKVVHMSPTRMLHHEARRMVFDAMYSVGTQWEDDERLLDLLAEHYNEEVSGYAANYWTWRPVADEYEAATQLNLLVNTVVRDMGDEYLMPNNPQHAA